MHIKLLYRKVLYVFLSLLIVFANTQNAFASSSWSVTGAISAGSRSIVSATKGGYKSAVNIAPSAGRLGAKLIKGGNAVALGLAVANILGDGVTWVLDPANNAVKYKKKEGGECRFRDGIRPPFQWANIEEAVAAQCSGKTIDYVNNTSGSSYIVKCGTSVGNYVCQDKMVDTYLPISQVANRVIANARSGHAPSQAVTRETAIEMVVAGDFDSDLMSGAVPTSDTRPLIPAVPGNQNGNVTHGSDTGVIDGDGTMQGASPGEQSDAAKDAADAAKRAADAAKDAAKAAADAAREAADSAQDLVNSGTDQAAIDAANDRAAAAEKSAAEAKAQAERAAQAANDRAAAAERAAQAATAAAQAAAAQAARDLAAAIAAQDAAAQAAATAAKAAADKALAEAKAKQEAAEKAAEKAKEEAAKPMEFELPAFCTWASVVCDYTVWVKEEYGKMDRWLKEEPVSTPAELMPIDDDSSGIGGIFQDKAEAGYVSFSRECPADVLIPVSLMGASQVLNISYAGFCHFASLIRPAVILGAWISGLLIISGGRARE